MASEYTISHHHAAMRQNGPTEARPFFQKAIELEPRLEEARRYLTEIDNHQ